MSGGGDRLDAAAPQENGQAEAGEAQCRLRVLGQPKLVIVGGGEQAAKVDAGSGCAFIAELADLGVLEKVDPHARLLRALAGVQERYPGCHASPSGASAPPPHEWGGDCAVIPSP